MAQHLPLLSTQRLGIDTVEASLQRQCVMMFGECKSAMYDPGLSVIHRIHKLVLDALGVKRVAAVIGGSMGGFSTLEWPLCTSQGYVKTIIAITTSAYHSAWGISWGEAQRQCIYADAAYNNGLYSPVPTGQPAQGLGAARMIGMLTYRSYASFDKRFGRRSASRQQDTEAWGKNATLPTPSPSETGSASSIDHTADTGRDAKRTKLDTEAKRITSPYEMKPETIPPAYAAQSYIQYQAAKFLKRFDANCYIALTTKMDVRLDTIPCSYASL